MLSLIALYSGSALQALCESPKINEHSVQICSVILDKIKGLAFKVSSDVLPLHALCKASVHTQSTEKICALLLELCPEWSSTKNEEGWLPLHLLCSCTCHQGAQIFPHPLHVLVCPRVISRETVSPGVLYG